MHERPELQNNCKQLVEALIICEISETNMPTSLQDSLHKLRQLWAGVLSELIPRNSLLFLSATIPVRDRPLQPYKDTNLEFSQQNQ